ncbi:MAG: cupredoxin domain-containing protein [Deltaproteobacteria bacterium]|nr:cupredoxin domain-containing protein [Deltaproteobacteria bacterium]
MRKWLVFGILVLAAGCSGAPVREGAVNVAPGERVVELKAESYSFTPANLAVPANTPVVLRIHTVDTFVPHSFILEGPGGNVIVSRQLAKGGDTLVRLSPLPAGTYVFYCDKAFLGSSHRSKGMEGKLEALPER